MSTTDIRFFSANTAINAIIVMFKRKNTMLLLLKI